LFLGDLNLYVIFFLLVLSSLMISTNSVLHLLLTAELLWITLYIITLFVGFVYDSLHFWVLNGAFVLPNTPDAIPAFDENDEPIKMMYEASVICN
jgi:hypothetical protein